MNEQQEKLYQAMLDMNEQAKAAGEPYIKDPTQAKKVFTRLTALTGPNTAADICARISDGQFEEELEEERRRHADALKDFADGEDGDGLGVIGRMEYLYMCLYMESHEESKDFAKIEMWQTMRGMDQLLRPEIHFVRVMQNAATNMFSRFMFENRQLRLGNRNLKDYTEEATIPAGNSKKYSFKLEHADKNKMTISTLKLLDYLLNNFADTHIKSVSIPIADFANDCNEDIGTKSKRDEFIKRVAADLQTLKDISFSWASYRRKSGDSIGYIGMNGGYFEVYRGNILWDWGDKFFKILQDMAPMDLHKENFRLDPKSNAYALARYIDANYRKNYDKKQLNKTYIRTLLKEAPLLPPVESMKRKGRKDIHARIIGPFFEDLSSIPWLVYTAYSKDGAALDTNALIHDPDYIGLNDFLDCYIIVNYDAFPPYEDRKQQREKHKIAKKKAVEKAIAANAARAREKALKENEKK